MSITETTRTLTGEATYELKCDRCETATRTVTIVGVPVEATSYDLDACWEALTGDWDHAGWKVLEVGAGGTFADAVLLCAACPGCDEIGHAWEPCLLEGAEVLQCALCRWTPHRPLPAGAVSSLPPGQAPKWTGSVFLLEREEAGRG